MKKGKNYRKALELFDKSKTYSIDEALEILEKFPKARFDEAVEVHIRTKIDAKKTDQQIRGTVDLPFGTGKKVVIAAFTESQQAEAQKAGADIVGGEDLIEKVKAGKAEEFDVAVATPEMMPKLAQIAKILGPKGLMPNPKTQTVGPKIAPLIEGLKKGRASYKSDKSGNLHLAIGKRSFSKDQLKENFQAFLEDVNKNKPAAVKGALIRSISISGTMTPGIKVKA